MENNIQIQMNDHPVKTVLAILTGSFVGIRDWLTHTAFSLDIGSMFTWGAFIVFLIACSKAIIVGCCSWAGASVAGWAKKKIMKHFKKQK